MTDVNSPPVDQQPAEDGAAAPWSIALDDLSGMLGQSIGPTQWQEVTQQQVLAFADATGDHQWIHTDAERARQGPFGGPIAHGYLTISLAPRLLATLLRVEGSKLTVNYGSNRVRFPAPVPIGSRIRAQARLAAVDEVDGGVQVQHDVTVECEGSDKPVCVAQILLRYYR